ncbi:DUF5372 family protein [Nonomuraea sp. M3C6]|uniref:DUF5372 family protein n=1 Tax=Nonomuraea marmarensis TaxID=3351344 RepID=A0ABW7AYR5_9ACTN
MTHPFHPLCGRDFKFVVHRRNWGEDQVYCRDEDGGLFSLPAAWTDVAGADPFVVAQVDRFLLLQSAPAEVAVVVVAERGGQRRAQAQPARRGGRPSAQPPVFGHLSLLAWVTY